MRRNGANSRSVCPACTPLSPDKTETQRRIAHRRSSRIRTNGAGTPEKYGNDGGTDRTRDARTGSPTGSSTSIIDSAASLQTGGSGLDSAVVFVAVALTSMGSRRAFGALAVCRRAVAPAGDAVLVTADGKTN